MTEISRRNFLKAITPLGWLGEARASGLGNLSTPAKISLIKDVAIFVQGGGFLITRGLEETEKRKPFKEKVLAFDWTQASKEKELEKFVSLLAEEYLRLTATIRVNKEDMIGMNKLNLYPDKEQFTKAIRTVEPDFNPTPRQYGYTHYATRRIFIDLGGLKEQVTTQAKQQKIDSSKTAGLALLDALWHEWGHLDVEDRVEGQFIRNPQAYFYSPKSGTNEQFRRYRGGAVYTDTYFGYLRYDEVLNETINVRRMIEQVGLQQISFTADYYENGIDFFPLFTTKVGIPLEIFYKLYATSDFEGLLTLLGQHLPGDEHPSIKGEKLATAIHQSNRVAFEQTGALKTIGR